MIALPANMNSAPNARGSSVPAITATPAASMGPRFLFFLPLPATQQTVQVKTSDKLFI